jgi:hypothetical protein
LVYFARRSSLVIFGFPPPPLKVFCGCCRTIVVLFVVDWLLTKDNVLWVVVMIEVVECFWFLQRTKRLCVTRKKERAKNEWFSQKRMLDRRFKPYP